MSTSQELEALLRGLLSQHKTLKIATAGGPTSPWIAGAYFAEAGPFTLQMVLETHGKTMKNILADARVAVMVADNHPFSLFAQGEARAKIVDGDVAAQVKVDLLAKNPEMAPFFGAPLQFVHLEITRWVLTDIPKGWLPGKELRAPVEAVAVA